MVADSDHAVAPRACRFRHHVTPIQPRKAQKTRDRAGRWIYARLRDRDGPRMSRRNGRTVSFLKTEPIVSEQYKKGLYSRAQKLVIEASLAM